MSDLSLRVACRYLYGGLVKLPPKVLETIDTWMTETVVGDLLYELEENSQGASSNAIQREITNKYHVPPRKMDNVEGDRFKLDLTGWEYLPGIQSHAGASQRIQKNIPSYRVLLRRRKIVSRYEGGWDQNQKVMVLEIPTISSPKRLEHVLKRVRAVLRHEMVHMVQTILGFAFGKDGTSNFLAGRLDRGHTPQSPGLPPSSAMTPEFMQELNKLNKQDQVKYRHLIKKIDPSWFGQKNRIYTLDDAEFYSLLSDEVEIFKDKFRKIGDPTKKIEAIRQWVDATPRGILSPVKDWLGIGSSQVFKTWKKSAPEKWKKAVREFYKAVL